jgi:hypothetical protein
VNTENMPRWRTSSFCSTSACVEIAEVPEGIMLRDSKNPHIAPFVFTKDEWSAFVQGVQAGEFHQA